jgi:hypothetical protein
VKTYSIPFNQRLIILTILVWPYAYLGWSALGILFPLATWMIWGNWGVVEVNTTCIRFRSSWSWRWCEVEWSSISQTDYVGIDTASLHLSDGRRMLVSYCGLPDSERLEVAGWIDHYSRSDHGLKNQLSSSAIA